MNYRRILSHNNQGDQSFLNPNDSSLLNQSTRSISSSSASMISTPSNNIRKLQTQQSQLPHGQNPSHHPQNPHGHSSSFGFGNERVSGVQGSGIQGAGEASSEDIVGHDTHSSTMDSGNDTFSRKSHRLRHNTNIVSKSKNHHPAGSNFSHNHHLKPKKSTNVNLVKNKLLNLQKSLKFYAKSKDEEEKSVRTSPNLGHRNFVLRKPINMNSYDYSVFTNYPNGLKVSENLPPNIKESQIKAWESAEKITNNLIFENDSDLSDDDIIEGETDEAIDPAANEPMTNDQPERDPIFNIIRAIPGIIPNQADIIFDGFKLLQQRSLVDQQTELNSIIEREEEMLWKDNRAQQLRREKLFKQSQSLTSKRKLQITQKKELFFKIFGANNTLNQDYITNNTSYSSLDNVMNTSKSFHEDNDEIKQILFENKEFEISLNETETNIAHHKNVLLQDLKGDFSLNFNTSTHNSPDQLSSPNNLDDFDYDKFQALITNKISKLYEEPGDMEEFNFKASAAINDEFNNFAICYLRKCIKVDDDNEETAYKAS